LFSPLGDRAGVAFGTNLRRKEHSREEAHSRGRSVLVDAQKQPDRSSSLTKRTSSIRGLRPARRA